MMRIFVCAILGAIAAAQEPELVLQRGHSDSITSIAYSPDGKFIATGSMDNTIKIWNASTGREIRTLTGHANTVTALIYLPDGAHLISASDDKSIREWEIATGKEVAQFQGSRNKVEWLALLPSGKSFASAGEDSIIRIWDIDGKKLSNNVRDFDRSGWVDALAVASDGNILAWAISGAEVILWDMKSDKKITTLKPDVNGWRKFSCFTFSNDCKSIFVARDTDLVKLNATGGQELFKRSWTDRLGAMCLSPDGKIVAGSAGTQVVFLDAMKGSDIKSLDVGAGQINAAAFSPDGKFFALAGADGTAKIVDVEKMKLTHSLSGNVRPVSSIAFSKDGKMLASGSYDSNLRLVDFSAGKGLQTLSGHRSRISSVAISPDGKRIASGGFDCEARVWDATTGSEVAVLKGHSKPILGIAFSPDGKMLASASQDETAIVWRTSDWTQLATVTLHKKDQYGASSVWAVAFSPDSSILATASNDKTVRLSKASDGKEIRVLSGHMGGVCALSYSPDGKILATSGFDGTLKMWDSSTGNEIRSIHAGETTVWSLAFSSDGRTLATAHDEKVVKVWDVASGKEKMAFSGFTGAVYSLCFCKEGKQVACAGAEGTISFWNSESGKITGTFVPFANSEWVFYTADRRFDCSMYGSQYCGWVSGLSYSSFEQFEERYRVKSLFERAMSASGAPEQKTADKSLPTPPDIIIKDPEDGATTASDEIEVKVTVLHSKDIKGVDLFVNGKSAATRGLLVVKKSGAQDKRKFDFNLKGKLETGENMISVQAIDEDGVKSQAESITITCTPQKIARPHLWLLAVGLSQYADTNIPSLKYGASDAVRFMEAAREQGKDLYEEVHAFLLTDQKATRKGILKAISEIGKGATQNDVAVIFIAGHGQKDNENNYYFVTYDAELDDLLSSAMQWRDIEAGLERIGTRKKFFMADTCHSAGIVGKRGIIENLQPLVEKMVKSEGVVFLFSSKESQVSYEDSKWGGGVFTSALVEAIQNRDSKVDTDGDGGISVMEIQQYVTRRVQELTKGMPDGVQQPRCASQKDYTDYPVLKSK